LHRLNVVEAFEKAWELEEAFVEWEEKVDVF
jgi:hypothetical protein